MIFLHIQALYNFFSLVFSWFALANLWLTFSIIVDLLPEQKIYLFGTQEITHWVNFAFKWLYLSFLALQFILALGNRPKGERLPYTITLWVYAFLSVYLIVCSVWLTVTSFRDIAQADSFIEIFTPPVGPLIAAMVSTFGIYFISSFLYRDPWHMFSSFLQYLCLAPSFTNVLNVYAFCNLHDVSWGTKGSDKAEALPSVSSSKSKDAEVAVVEDKTQVQADVDAAFKETVTRAVTKVDKKEVPEKPNLDDQNKTFRTRLVAVWMLSNVALSIAIENVNGLTSTDASADQARLHKKQNTYFSFILYSTFGLSAIRFTGCLFYFVKRNLFRFFRKN
jgi:chitin synthase